MSAEELSDEETKNAFCSYSRDGNNTNRVTTNEAYLPMQHLGYGEEFVDALRRSRLNRNRPPSRTKSDMGEERHFESRYSGHSQYGYVGYHTMGPRPGRTTTTGMPQHSNDYYQQTPIAYQLQRARSPPIYDSYPSPFTRFQKSDSESEDDGTYSIPRNANNSFSSYVASNQQRQPVNHFGAKEYYYFGIIRLDVENASNIFRRFKVPNTFEHLNAIEKAAYLYYAFIYNKLFPKGVEKFQLTFNREFYKYKCEGDNSDAALTKICKSMFDEFMARRQNSKQKAFEASQKQLFSDDKDSIDGVSDRVNTYDKDDDSASDIYSVDQRAPLKFRSPHAFINFGTNGKMIALNPDQSNNTILVNDIKSSLKDSHSKRIIDAAQNFKGPLLPDTPSHSVLLYIQTQMMKVQNGEVAKENPNSCDVVDCLLLWKLLEMVVKQQGRVTGPDIASLLVSIGYSASKTTMSNHREKNNVALEAFKTISADPKAFDIFTHYLLRGHVDEAIKYAINNGLYADAIVLVRRIFNGDEKKLADIEARFLSTRSSSSPVMTLAAVANGEQAPILTNPPIDDIGSWRSHAAIVLANLYTNHAKETVYHLGCVLAKREYHAAADFCFLAVSLLSNFEGFDVFQKPASDEPEEYEQYISLIHASLPDDEWDSTICRYGFSLTDLHATEIFDYAIKMNAPVGFVSPLQMSKDFQRRRLEYAKLLAYTGGFQAEAFSYLMSVACSIWSYYQSFTIAELTELADLADSLHLNANSTDTTWIESLNKMIEYVKHTSVQQVVSQQMLPERQNHETTAEDTSSRQVTSQEKLSKESNQEDLCSHQKSSPIPVTIKDVEVQKNEVKLKESQEQTVSKNYGEQLCQIQTTLYHLNQHKEDGLNNSSLPVTVHTSSETSSLQQKENIPTPSLQEEKAFHLSNDKLSQQQLKPIVPQPSAPQTLGVQDPINEAKKSTGNGGIFGSLINKVLKAVPGSADMILPDDKNPSIRWDANLGKWVGEGIEEVAQTCPPPQAIQALQHNQASSNLRASRTIGGTRYLNPGQNNGPSRMKTEAPFNTDGALFKPTIPMNFSLLMPSMPDDIDSVSPFSGETVPTVYGIDQSGQEET